MKLKQTNDNTKTSELTEDLKRQLSAKGIKLDKANAEIGMIIIY